MDSIYSDDDSLPTFQEADILACFQDKSQIIDNSDKKLDVSYSNRLLNFLKYDQNKASTKNSFLELENQSNANALQQGQSESKEVFNQSFIPPDEEGQQLKIQQQIQQKGLLKRQDEKKSFAIPFSSQQQIQIQNQQRIMDKFDRPPLSQRLDTRSNLMNSTTQQNFKKANNISSQQSLTDRNHTDGFNPFQDIAQPIKREVSSVSLRSSREGKLQAENIKNFYLDLQKQMEKPKINDENYSEKENLNPNIQQQNSIKSIQVEDIQLQKNIFQKKNSNKQFQNIATIDDKVKGKQNQQAKQTQQDLSNNKEEAQQVKVHKQSGYLFIDDEQNSISESKNSNDTAKQIDNYQSQKALQEQKQYYLHEQKNSLEQNDILQIVTKIRGIKQQIDDVNKIINLKKKEIDNFMKSSTFQNSSIALQKSKEEDQNTLKKLTASTAFLNIKYQEMTQNCNDYMQKRDKLNYISNQCESTQDQLNQENTSSFVSKYNNNHLQNYLSQNTTQINNSSIIQIQSNSKQNCHQNGFYSANYVQISSSNKQNAVVQQMQASKSNSIEKREKESNSKSYASSSNINTLCTSRSNQKSQQNGYSQDKIQGEGFSTYREYSSNKNQSFCSNNSFSQNEQQFLNQNKQNIYKNQKPQSYHQKQSDSLAITSSQSNFQTQSQCLRTKSQESKNQISKENSVVYDQNNQVSSQEMIQNLISKLSLNKYTNKLNKLLQNHPQNIQSNTKDPKNIYKQSVDQQKASQIIPQKINPQLAKAPSQQNLITQNSSQFQQQITQQPVKQARSYSYQEKFSLQKQQQQAKQI
ncbi:hypothetical protein TTHERM_00865370 (macronuclear) [Tetrahymena thermophila SB210]|uniref:Uncharacterized protein n=1 Tax=Tetrahymena thermophila (strain SB210) TaxID=312017 RepID=Q24FC6_TETTS|nr:hypothetical protein TTHERM_00865370 [Tetrahymena thermophila SB210]EAS06532.2 hypothetical protein TTHERM_00865370 [Tetrahymena thermophila SB210]|eukprot:XP_001026777.2 hypothetical protein TTHERM_00865370 [Tetrahymena thermophila SB210]